ncbi:MAG: hypothetical protein Q8O71_01140, partial [bacterium]|nr:hypothetical protein [bacterium]
PLNGRLYPKEAMIYRSPKYKAWIKSLPCGVCGIYSVDPHHVRKIRWGAGNTTIRGMTTSWR